MEIKITANEAKKALLHFFLYGHGRYLAMTEYRFADVFALTRNWYGEEVEIKVDKWDLKKELDIVSWCMGLGPRRPGNFNKTWKHSKYLECAGHKLERDYYNGDNKDIPNRFYFAVVEELEGMALAGTAHVPYGVIVMTRRGTGKDAWIDIRIAKKAINLHGTKVEQETLMPVMRKVCTETLNVMQKLDKKEKEDREVLEKEMGVGE